MVIQVRLRAVADIGACEQLARRVVDTDGYPPVAPNDLGRFIESPEAFVALVAAREGNIVGHVCVNPTSSRAVMELASRELQVDHDQLAVVARLIVSPDCRRCGIGRALLDAAVDCARSLDRWAILDVAVQFHAAVALYERCGWRRLGAVAAQVGANDVIEEFVYAAPP